MLGICNNLGVLPAHFFPRGSGRDYLANTVRHLEALGIRDGLLHGLRVDHIDGLRDPRGYLERLRELAESRRQQTNAGFPIFVEKILAHDEHLPPDWPVEGTSGYEFLNEVEAILLSPPGCGKSAFAKSLGNETHRPTLVLDVGRLLGSLVGQSEQNMRQALKLAERLRCSLREEGRHTVQPPVTVSIGIASCGRPEVKRAEDLLKSAREAVGKAKAADGYIGLRGSAAVELLVEIVEGASQGVIDVSLWVEECETGPEGSSVQA